MWRWKDSDTYYVARGARSRAATAFARRMQRGQAADAQGCRSSGSSTGVAYAPCRISGASAIRVLLDGQTQYRVYAATSRARAPSACGRVPTASRRSTISVSARTLIGTTGYGRSPACHPKPAGANSSGKSAAAPWPSRLPMECGWRPEKSLRGKATATAAQCGETARVLIAWAMETQAAWLKGIDA